MVVGNDTDFHSYICTLQSRDRGYGGFDGFMNVHRIVGVEKTRRGIPAAAFISGSSSISKG